MPKTSTTNTFNVNNSYTSDATEISNAFNQHFESVFSKDDGGVPKFDKFETLPPIDDLEITETGIFNLLLNLDEKKSSGPDNIPNAFLKRYAEWSSKFLLFLIYPFQQVHYLVTGKFPR